MDESYRDPSSGDSSLAAASDLLRRLTALGIQTTTYEHPPVFTVEEARALRGDIPGGHVKNLFLRNRKGRMWLVVIPEDRSVDLKQLADLLGAGRFSFGSPERLRRYLGVTPGSVTPFGVVNDREGAVSVVVDRAILDTEPLNFHPLVNSKTTSIQAADFLRFLEDVGHPADVADLSSAYAPVSRA